MYILFVTPSWFYFDTASTTWMNKLKNIFPVTMIAQFYCTLSVDSLDHNLFMHTDKYKMERLICVRIYIL